MEGMGGRNVNVFPWRWKRVRTKRAGRWWVEKGPAGGKSRQGAQGWDTGSLFHGTGQREDRAENGNNTGEFWGQEVRDHSPCSKTVECLKGQKLAADGRGGES